MRKLLILMLVLLVSSAIGQVEEVSIKSGMQAPTFSLPDMDQNYISLRDFCGEKLRKPWKNKTNHVVVLSFFATWCKPCMKEIPHLEKIQEEFKNQPVKFFLVDVGEEREKVLSFQEKKKVNLDILLDRYQKTADKYDALTLPRLVVIDREGIIRKEAKGFSNPEAFENDMKKLISDLLKM